MARGLSSTQSRFIFISGFLVLTIIAGLSGCAPLPTEGAPPNKSATCTPTSTKVNIYRVTPASWTDMIFQYVYPYSVIPTPIPPATAIPIQINEQQLLEARYAAFLNLINETKRWSDTQTIKMDDSSEAQITVTFISPELLQAVYLSHVLKHRFFTSDFPTQIQGMLNSIANRDELLFLVTVTTTNNGDPNSIVHMIDLPIDNMNLYNSENLKLPPNHDDHNLEQPINSSLEPVFGYLAYPFTMQTFSDCKWFMDPKYNTNIVISVPNILLDGVGNTPYTWTIPYTSLINANIPANLPTFIIPQGFDTNLLTPLRLPPSLAMNPNGTNPEAYWQNFARYVWNQITLGNY